MPSKGSELDKRPERNPHGAFWDFRVPNSGHLKARGRHHVRERFPEETDPEVKLKPKISTLTIKRHQYSKAELPQF